MEGETYMDGILRFLVRVLVWDSVVFVGSSRLPFVRYRPHHRLQIASAHGESVKI